MAGDLSWIAAAPCRRNICLCLPCSPSSQLPSHSLPPSASLTLPASISIWGFDPLFGGPPGSSRSKESASSAGNLGLIPGSGRSPREENGYSFQYSCLENPMDRGAWQAIVHRVAESQTQLKWLSIHEHICMAQGVSSIRCLFYLAAHPGSHLLV